MRRYISGWFAANRHRIAVLRTPEGERYDREMALWAAAGRPSELKPDWSDRGEGSLLQAVKVLKSALARGEEIIVIVDDRDARDAVRAVRADIAMLGTRTFIRWLEEDFAAPGADTAWQTVLLATGGSADEGESDDPVYIRPED